MKSEVFATKLPKTLKRRLDEICQLTGIKKNFLVEQAIREKIEDLLDAHDLRDAIKEATGFHEWETVRRELK